MLRKIFRIQYASDFHLELHKPSPAFNSLLKPCAPYLALAGDIGHPDQLRELFAWAAPQWKRIFFVAGNHDYYGATYEDRHEELKAVVKPYANIHFLHSQAPAFFCEEENVAVLGLTLWTSVSIHSHWKSVSDYTRIRFSAGTTFANLNQLHLEEKTILDREITYWTYQGAQICVISHHLPSFRLIHPQFAMSTVNDCFASNCDALIRSPVRLWIYGHTHSCSHHVLGKTVCLCNAKGYIDESVPGWRSDVWMEFLSEDPQEAEAFAKRTATPLHLEEEEVQFF